MDDDSAPHLRLGEFAVIDPTDTSPQHGEAYAIRWACGRTSIEQLISQRLTNENGEFIGWWTRSLSFVPYDVALQFAEQRARPGSILAVSSRCMVDGPRRAEAIQRATVGRVVGIFEAAPEPISLLRTGDRGARKT
ncbi:MAG: hypothetical protein Q7T86_19465 [Hyphomicrobiaceae bacterium]|nr:hypothetical protein [Hyphomicrobiaceae bacterium]